MFSMHVSLYNLFLYLQVQWKGKKTLKQLKINRQSNPVNNQSSGPFSNQLNTSSFNIETPSRHITDETSVAGNVIISTDNVENKENLFPHPLFVHEVLQIDPQVPIEMNKANTWNNLMPEKPLSIECGTDS